MSITGGKGTRAIATRYPVTDGIIAETTSQTGHEENLVPEQGTNYPKRLRKGITYE